MYDTWLVDVRHGKDARAWAALTCSPAQALRLAEQIHVRGEWAENSNDKKKVNRAK